MDTPFAKLGDAVRDWRLRLAPEDVGMVATQGRKTIGLRREELAALAGLSVDYITRIEQGRARPSTATLDALARSLVLSREERDHAYLLAGHPPPTPDEISTLIPPGVRRLLARLEDQALAVFSADFTLITWTPLWAALMGDPSDREDDEMNLLRRIFRRTDTNASFGTYPAFVLDETSQYRADLVADIRATAGRYPKDRRVAALIAELSDESPEFARLWSQGTVARHDSTRKVVHNPVGDINVDCDTITVPGADLRIFTYTAARGTRDAELMDFLRVTRPTRVEDHSR